MNFQSETSPKETYPLVLECSGMNVLCGVGILSTPYAIKEGGWIGLLILFLFAAISCYTGILLRRCLDSESGLETYPDIGQAAFGTIGRIFISVIRPFSPFHRIFLFLPFLSCFCLLPSFIVFCILSSLISFVFFHLSISLLLSIFLSLFSFSFFLSSLFSVSFLKLLFSLASLSLRLSFFLCRFFLSPSILSVTFSLVSSLFPFYLCSFMLSLSLSLSLSVTFLFLPRHFSCPCRSFSTSNSM